MSFDFVNNGMAYSTYGAGAPIPNQAIQQQYGIYNNQQPQQMPNGKPYVDPKLLETPKITTGGGIKFTITDKSSDNSVTIPVDKDLPDSEKKKLPRTKKESGNNNIIRASDNNTLTGTVEEIPTAYSYYETTGMLRDTLGQIDSLNNELMQEFESVKNSRTMKNKYNVLVGLSENVGSLISNRISVIKEINASISKSNDLDYKKLKDNKAAAATMDDDKYIADLYKSFITNPQAQIQMQQMPMMDTSMYGSTGIVRADVNNNGGIFNNTVDNSYTNYIANATPEQRLMMYEGNNNIKQCMVYDASTGARAFQYFDTSTMQPIPNMPVYSDILLDEFNIDLNNKIAKSSTMKEQMPLVVINDNITSQY